MFDSVILLTGPRELPVLSAALKRHRSELAVIPAPTAEALLAIEDGTLRRSRLIAFATPVIVPASILQQLGWGAVNFHPGPPDHPGFCPAQFAVYEGARRFGATAHIMAERVDEGPIFDVLTFDVAERATVFDLEVASFRELARLFWRNAQKLARNEKLPEPLPVNWNGPKSSRAQYCKLTTLTADIGREEFERRVRAFGGNYFGMPLRVMLHGVPFAYAPPPLPDQPPPVPSPR